MTYRLTRQAEEQIASILVQSAGTFGLAAATRYLTLILAALDHIGQEPELPGSRPVGHRPGIRCYALRSSRLRIAPMDRVVTPRHAVVYRVAADGHATILGLVHDRMLLSRAVRRLDDASGPCCSED